MHTKTIISIIILIIFAFTQLAPVPEAWSMRVQELDEGHAKAAFADAMGRAKANAAAEIRARNREYLKSKGWWDEIGSIRYRPLFIEEMPDLPEIMDQIAEREKENKTLARKILVPLFVSLDDIPKVTDEEIKGVIKDHIKSLAYFLQSTFLYSQGKDRGAARAYQKALKQARKEYPRAIQRKREELRNILVSIRSITNQKLRQMVEEEFLKTIELAEKVLDQSLNRKIGLLGLFDTATISDDIFTSAEELYMRRGRLDDARILFKLGLSLYNANEENYHIPRDFAFNIALIDLITNPKARGIELLKPILATIHGMFTGWFFAKVSSQSQLGKNLEMHSKQTKDNTMQASSYVKEHGVAVVLGAGQFVVLPLVEMLREKMPDSTLKYDKIVLVELGENLSEQALNDLVSKGAVAEEEANRVEIINADASLILEKLTSRIDEIMYVAVKQKPKKFPSREIEGLFREIADQQQITNYVIPVDKRLFADRSIKFIVLAMAISDFTCPIKDYIDIWSRCFPDDDESSRVLREWSEMYDFQVQRNVADLVIKESSRILSDGGVIFFADPIGEVEDDGANKRKVLYGPKGLEELIPPDSPLYIVNRKEWIRPFNIEAQKGGYVIEALALKKEVKELNPAERERLRSL